MATVVAIPAYNFLLYSPTLYIWTGTAWKNERYLAKRRDMWVLPRPGIPQKHIINFSVAIATETYNNRMLIEVGLNKRIFILWYSYYTNRKNRKWDTVLQCVAYCSSRSWCNLRDWIRNRSRCNSIRFAWWLCSISFDDCWITHI